MFPMVPRHFTFNLKKNKDCSRSKWTSDAQKEKRPVHKVTIQKRSVVVRNPHLFIISKSSSSLIIIFCGPHGFDRQSLLYLHERCCHKFHQDRHHNHYHHHLLNHLSYRLTWNPYNIPKTNGNELIRPVSLPSILATSEGRRRRFQRQHDVSIERRLQKW